MKIKRFLSWMLGIASLMLIGVESIHLSNRNHGTEPTKIGTLIEKREVPTRKGFDKNFHVVWEKHPTMLNKHEEFSVDDNSYYTTSIGEKVVFLTADWDYPYLQQTSFLIFSCVILIVVNMMAYGLIPF